MGFVNAKVELESLTGVPQRREVELLADTGALCSVVPGSILRDLGVQPRMRLDFELADGRTIEREVGEVRFHFDGRNAASRVIFGEESDSSLLGVVTMEELGLEIDPVRRKIRPTRMILY